MTLDGVRTEMALAKLGSGVRLDAMTAALGIATIADGVSLTGAGDVTLDASGEHTAATQADQGSAGGVAVTPVVALTLANDESTASIGAVSGGTLSVDGSISVSATQTATEATEAMTPGVVVTPSGSVTVTVSPVLTRYS